jgi:GNAT superfamily N-acetyltransferase
MLQKITQNVVQMWNLPRIRINLMQHATRENDPFFDTVVRKFYQDARRRHRKFPLVRTMEVGVAVCRLPDSFDEYLRQIEAAGRRNYKKAGREGCSFRRIAFNDHLDDIKEIRQSSEFRQGRRMPDSYLADNVKPCTDPASCNPLHDYAYFGVFREGKLIAYAGCLISGELCMINHILGHADSLELGVVPYLIVELARYLREHHAAVRSYAYGTYFGASESLRRFKRKFLFLPHRVQWALGETSEGTAAAARPLPAGCEPPDQVRVEIPSHLGYQLIYRQTRSERIVVPEPNGVEFVFLAGANDAIRHFGTLRRYLGWAGAIKTLAKLATPRRSLYLVLKDGVVASTGWCTAGLCKFYPIESEAVVIGPIWTSPAFRGQGLATYGVQRVLNQLMDQQRQVVYIDTFKTNRPSQRVIEKCGFGAPVGVSLR